MFAPGDRWPRNCLATRQVFLGIAWDWNGTTTGFADPCEKCVFEHVITLWSSHYWLKMCIDFQLPSPRYTLPMANKQKTKAAKGFVLRGGQVRELPWTDLSRNEMQMMIVSSRQSFLCMDSWMMWFCICWGCSYIVEFQCPKPNMDTLLGWFSTTCCQDIAAQTFTKQGSCSHPKPPSSLWWVGIWPCCIILCGLWVCQVTLLRFPIPYVNIYKR